MAGYSSKYLSLVKLRSLHIFFAVGQDYSGCRADGNDSRAQTTTDYLLGVDEGWPPGPVHPLAPNSK